MLEVPFSETLVQRLAVARRVAVLTGAGISAESGIPTFREIGGIWEKFRPEELANVDAFLKNPDLVQRWYRERRRIASAASPNAGHRALVSLEEIVPEFTLITQNVDDLHTRAGSKNIIELHGNVTRNYCIDCNKPAREAELAPEDKIFACSACGGLIRPDVVWFGEMLPPRAIEEAFLVARRADVFLSIGTSAVVHPAADIPLVARDNGAYVAEINIESSAIGHLINETVLGPSGTVLSSLLESVLDTRRAAAE